MWIFRKAALSVCWPAPQILIQFENQTLSPISPQSTVFMIWINLFLPPKQSRLTSPPIVLKQQLTGVSGLQNESGARTWRRDDECCGTGWRSWRNCGFVLKCLDMVVKKPTRRDGPPDLSPLTSSNHRISPVYRLWERNRYLRWGKVSHEIQFWLFLNQHSEYPWFENRCNNYQNRRTSCARFAWR